MKKEKCIYFEWKDPFHSQMARIVILHLMDASANARKGVEYFDGTGERR